MTTLFMLISVDGKISTGDTDLMDVDNDYPTVKGVKEGLQQYYNMEQETDLFSLNTGRVFAKIGVNEKKDHPARSPVSFVVIDNLPHLTAQGVAYLSKKATKLIIVTTNTSHPAHTAQKQARNICVIPYGDEIDFANLFQDLKEKHGVERLTIQSGGTLNTTLVRKGLVDRVLLVVAPALIGGKETPTLMDGMSLHTPEELSHIKALELVQAKPLKNSYLLLEYIIKNLDTQHST